MVKPYPFETLFNCLCLDCSVDEAHSTVFLELLSDDSSQLGTVRIGAIVEGREVDERKGRHCAWWQTE